MKQNTATALIRRNIMILSNALENGLLDTDVENNEQIFLSLTEAKRAWQALLPLVNQGIGLNRPIREDKPTIREVE